MGGREYEFLGEEGSAPIKAWINGVQCDDNTIEQARKAAKLPFVTGMALMPDAHLGKGATVGSVIATQRAIVPSMVGVDIGCGMVAVRTSLFAEDLPDSLERMRGVIEAHVPHGRTDNGGKNDRGAWGEVPDWITQAFLPMWPELKPLIEKHPLIEKAAVRSAHHLSTLGTGNHFIEVCLDTEGRVWVMLHSGSRGIGNKIGDYFINLAKKDMQKWFINLPDQDLAYLPEGTDHFDDYIAGVSWAQKFAKTNRDLMLNQVLFAMRKVLGKEFEADLEVINCFAAETPVMTRNGVKTIGSLSNTTTELLTTGGVWVNAPINSFGRQKLWKITLLRSKVVKEIYATVNHGWIIDPVQRKNFTHKFTDELRKGDRLATVFPKQRFSDPVNSAIARGFVFGDGSQTSVNTTCANFSGPKIESVLPFFIEHGIGLPPRVYPGLTRINGLPGEWKKFPALTDDPNYLYGWLIGYFAADGDVDKTGRPTLSSANKDNLEFVRNLCTEIGIGTFGIRVNVRMGYGTEPSPLYLLGFMRNDLPEGFFLNAEHKKRFVASKAVDRRAWTVISAEETDREEEVFCATVEGTHTFALEDNILTQNCHHNYVTRENHFGQNVWLTRKGAVRAGKKDLGIIPGSMGARSYIVRGKGNPESFHSCSHGAGRLMSRNEAKKYITLDAHIEATKHVECRKDKDVLDESPAAYKPIDRVMEAQRDLVEVVYELTQILNVKG